MDKRKTVFTKRKWWILPLFILPTIISYPFFALLVNEVTGLNFGELYTFGLPMNEFMTPWIALWGVIGATFGVIQMQQRISIQGKQFAEQINKQNEQIQIQQKQFKESQFSTGVELLGNDKESARIGGLFSLSSLVKDYPDEYSLTVCNILCSHIRTVTNNHDYHQQYTEKPSTEIQTCIDLLFKGDGVYNKFNKNLKGSFLCGVDLSGAKLINTDFSRATLSDIVLIRNEICKVKFFNAKLNKLSFLDCIFFDIFFDYATLENVNFYGNTELRKVEFIFSKLVNIYFNARFLGDNKKDFAFSENVQLYNVSFRSAELINVDFRNTELSDINFQNANLTKDVNFNDTNFENSTFEEITRIGYSLELTKEKQEIN
jgi:uncharacterized protein YjbI with pentapeptide repeats